VEGNLANRQLSLSAKDRLQRLAPVEFKVDRYPLSDEQKSVLHHLIRAAESIDKLFWQQICPNADNLRKQFAPDFSADASLGKYFSINYGPYDRLSANEPFLPVGSKPPGAGFFPPDLTKKELLAFIAKHPEQRAALLSPLTVVARDGEGLSPIPYHKAYAALLEQAAGELVAAAASESRPAFQRYLKSRAEALRSDDYYESDLLWIDLPPNGIDAVIGPYEVYEDELMGVKASYEALITFQDPIEMEKVAGFTGQVEQFNQYLTDRVKIAFESPGPTRSLVVADLLYSAGDARKGIPAIAFTLPNDEKVIEDKGVKEVILRNVLEAKFREILWPICESVYKKDIDYQKASKGYLHHTVLHEICHSLGPHRISVDGQATTVNQSLAEFHTTLEEAKADVLGACWLMRMADEQASGDPVSALAAYLPGLLRAIRFGKGEAHGRANLLQFNYLCAHGVVRVTDNGLPIVTASVLEETLFALAREILKIQAEGDYRAAQLMTQKYCQYSPFTAGLIQNLAHLPIDIAISFSGLE
jgi:hypothetical protein